MRIHCPAPNPTPDSLLSTVNPTPTSTSTSTSTAAPPTTASHAIGIDIGGTKIALALVALDSHRIVARSLLATEAGLGFDRAVARIAHAIDDLSRASRIDPLRLRGIGIGCAGPVDPALGLVNNPYTLEGWNQCDIVRPLHQRFGVPVVLENDADAAALGESVSGAGRGANPVVMLTFGTGVGGATIVHGAITRGVQGEHPELGHVPVLPDGPACYCGIAGCLESVASGTALANAGTAHGWTDARAVFAAADAGSPAARAIVDRAVQAGATAAWTLCHTLLPQRLVLGGGIMETEFERFAGAMRIRLSTATQFTRSRVEIVRAALGNDAGLVGAACLVASAREIPTPA